MSFKVFLVCGMMRMLDWFKAHESPKRFVSLDALGRYSVSKVYDSIPS